MEMIGRKRNLLSHCGKAGHEGINENRKCDDGVNDEWKNETLQMKNEKK